MKTSIVCRTVVRSWPCWEQAHAHGLSLQRRDAVLVPTGCTDGSPNWYGRPSSTPSPRPPASRSSIRRRPARPCVVDRHLEGEIQPAGRRAGHACRPSSKKRAAKDGLLQPYKSLAERRPDRRPTTRISRTGHFVPLVNNYTTFIYDSSSCASRSRSEDLRGPVGPEVQRTRSNTRPPARPATVPR